MNIGLVAKNSTFLYHLWNQTALFYPQIMTKPKRKKIWDFIFLFRTTPPFTMVESDFFFKVVLRGVVVRKRKIASQIFFLLGLVIICGYKIAVQFQRPHKMVEFFATAPMLIKVFLLQGETTG